MRTDHSSLEADTGLRVERLGVVVPERDRDLLALGAHDLFAPWWTDEDVQRHFPAIPGKEKRERRG